MSIYHQAELGDVENPVHAVVNQRKRGCDKCSKKQFPQHSAPGTITAAVPAVVHEVLRSQGQPLDKSAREFMETGFGWDFSRVRIHSDAKAAQSARSLNAQAFTAGQEIAFDSGKYTPDTYLGRRLLAHELAHTVQQSLGSLPDGVYPAMNGSLDLLEQESNSAAAQIVNLPGQVAAGSKPLDLASHRKRTRLGSKGLAIQRFPAASSQGMAFSSQQTSTFPAPRSAQTNQTSPSPQSPLVVSYGTLTRAQFEEIMLRRFVIRSVRTGTFQEQVSHLTPRAGLYPSAPPNFGLSSSSWRAWDPGTSSPLYGQIVEAFDNFENRIGGLPPTNEILFFDMSYELNSIGAAVADPNTGASFGAGHMTIYRAATTMRTPLPLGRSLTSGSYQIPPGSLGVSGIRGQSPGAPLLLPSPEESFERAITHELGHGLVEAALAIDPGMINSYKREAGWTAGTPPELYDAGVPAVQQAISSGAQPPAAYQITEDNWNDPRWSEQPLTNYMVSGGPSEDFPEAVMAYLRSPATLRSRSSRRYRFIDANRHTWLPRLMRFLRPGDYPSPSGRERSA